MMVIKESHIRATLEEYINLENSLNDLTSAKKETQQLYNRYITEHKPKDNTYDLHKATPIINYYCELEEIDNKAKESGQKLSDLKVKIKKYIDALKGASLLLHFDFDELDHRAGEHLFVVENDELICYHRDIT
jgi:hypothetical protein